MSRRIPDEEWVTAFDTLCRYFQVSRNLMPRAAVAAVIEGVERGARWRLEEREHAHKAQFERDTRIDLRALQRAQGMTAEQLKAEIRTLTQRLSEHTDTEKKEK